LIPLTRGLRIFKEIFPLSKIFSTFDLPVPSNDPVPIPLSEKLVTVIFAFDIVRLNTLELPYSPDPDPIPEPPPEPEFVDVILPFKIIRLNTLELPYSPSPDPIPEPP
jgi:hypothetical protein